MEAVRVTSVTGSSGTATTRSRPLARVLRIRVFQVSENRCGPICNQRCGLDKFTPCETAYVLVEGCIAIEWFYFFGNMSSEFYLHSLFRFRS